MNHGRPENLIEIRNALANNEEQFAILLGNFLDQFYHKPSGSAFLDEPPLIAESVVNGAYYDAYLAALAEFLAAKLGSPAPAWVEDHNRFLPSPRVFGKNPKLRELLISECPIPFKRRGVIISVDALSRA